MVTDLQDQQELALSDLFAPHATSTVFFPKVSVTGLLQSSANIEFYYALFRCTTHKVAQVTTIEL
jgi:hypothetical protein